MIDHISNRHTRARMIGTQHYNNTRSIRPRWHPRRSIAAVLVQVIVAMMVLVMVISNHGDHESYSTNPHFWIVVTAWTSSSSSSFSSVVPSRSRYHGQSHHRYDAHTVPTSGIFTPRIKSLTAVPTIRQLTRKSLVKGKINSDTEKGDSGITSKSRQPSVRRNLTIRTMKPSSDDTTADASFNPEQFVLPFLGVLATIAVGIGVANGYTVDDLIAALSHPQETLRQFIETIKDMGPIGIVYFGLFYLLAETFAVPATPLSLSAGYLFGFANGFTVVLAAATVAACIGFFVGKTFLRSYVEQILQGNPKFAKIDRAVGKEGFKLLVLVRLSPIFPFSISNYIYGASSIDFVSFFWGTLLGFTPSTLAYVYTGMVGQEVMFGTTDGQPWYIYVAGFTVLLTLLKLVTDVATGIIEAIDDDDVTK